jgi:hypothetical protein
MLFPWQLTVPLGAIVSVQVLVPPQVTFPPLPADSLHALPPVHVDVHPEPQEPEQLDLPAQLVVQLAPQLTLQSFFDWQLKDALLGRELAAASVFDPDPPPREHVPPVMHEQLDPVHEQAPVQSRELTAPPPQARNSDATTASPKMVLRMRHDEATFVRAGERPKRRG